MFWSQNWLVSSPEAAWVVPSAAQVQEPAPAEQLGKEEQKCKLCKRKRQKELPRKTGLVNN